MSILGTCGARQLTRNFGRPECPKCGSTLLVAEKSEFNLKGGIRHAWSCDECGHQFATAISLRPFVPGQI